MLITILEIDRSQPQPAAGGSAIAYPCVFRAEEVQGSALFIPQNRPSAAIIGRELFVEVSAERVSSLQVLPSQDQVFSLVPLPTPGDYRGTGRVVNLLWLDESPENAVIEIGIGPWHFSVSDENMGPAALVEELEYGQWVSVAIYGLQLKEVAT